MREQHLMRVFLGLNIALAGAFAVYLYLANDRRPAVVTTAFSVSSQTRQPPPAPITAAGPTNELSLPPEVVPAPTTNGPTAESVEALKSSAKVMPMGREMTWRDVSSPAYRAYMQNLRLSGCPEAQVRRIVLEDIDQLMAQKRLAVAEANDPKWWRPESYYAMTTVPNLLRERARHLEEDRRELIRELLGADAAVEQAAQDVFWTDVQLTGAVLGKLSPERHQAVQLICRRSIERQQAAFWEQTRSGQPLNLVERARLREQTRQELREVLNESEMEEFLLRYSHNASRLRDELRGFNPTAEEFRKIFRVTDPIDHALQVRYGGPETLSPKQAERWRQQRDAAVREVLGPDRYLDYLLTKDPLYRRAQTYATQYGAPSQAVQTIYEMTKRVEGKRKQIMDNRQLTPQEKSQALRAVNLEQHQGIQKIVQEARRGKPQAN